MWMTVLKEIWGKYNMKKIPLRLIFLVSLLFFSCSSLEISTVKDPNRDINNLSGFLVFCDVPDIGIGNKPIDGGYYLFNVEEKMSFSRKNLPHQSISARFLEQQNSYIKNLDIAYGSGNVHRQNCIICLFA